jgi:Protein of unknown function (DUF3309)
MGLVLLIIFVLILLGGFGYIGGVPYGYGAGHGGIGIAGLIVIVLLFLVLTGRL